VADDGEGAPLLDLFLEGHGSLGKKGSGRSGRFVRVYQ